MDGIQIPTKHRPLPIKNSITVLSNHLTPQAGLIIYNDKIKLVSTDIQVSQKENTTLPASFEPYEILILNQIQVMLQYCTCLQIQLEKFA